MTLVTRCPECHAVFRLAGVQLHLHNGEVRCGQCKQVFNGFIELIAVPDAYIQPATLLIQPALDQLASDNAATALIALADTQCNVTGIAAGTVYTCLSYGNIHYFS